MLKCAECGKPIENAYYINGVAYGYNCYKQKLTLIYKQWEDEHNKEYSIKCFAAMQIFQGKKSNSFHDSVCKQWNECKKLTAKQLECIIKGFTAQEKINFWLVWHSLTNDENLKSDLASWLENEIQDFSEHVENEAVINCLLSGIRYKKHGFHFLRDVNDSETVYIMENGKNNKRLNENLEDEEIEVIKIVEGCQ